MAKKKITQADRRWSWSEEELLWYKLTAKNTPNYKLHKKKLEEDLAKWDSPHNKDTEATKLYKLLTLERYEKVKDRQTLIKYLPTLIRDGSDDKEAIQASFNAIFADLIAFMEDLGENAEITRLEERWYELEWRDFALEAKIEGSRDLRLLQGLIKRHSPNSQMSLFDEAEETSEEE